jgi:magnesium transporter
VLEAYLREFEAIELALEEFDERVMRGRHDDAEDELARLVDLRQQIGRLRRALVSHSAIFLALAQPELEAITSSDHAHRFGALRGQLEEVVQVARDSRDAVFGSFDVLIARSEQRTNEIMKVLTLGALLFLPGALIAGVLGMNFRIGLFDTGWYFWVVCAGIVALGAATLVVARARDWI